MTSIDLNDLTGTVAEFMRRAGQLDETGLGSTSNPRGYLHRLQEEVDELIDAMGTDRQLEVDDALIDIAWTAIGWLYKRRGVTTANEQIREVNRANIDKVEPIENMVFYPDDPTKVAKPPGWTPPDHAAAIRRAHAGDTTA